MADDDAASYSTGAASYTSSNDERHHTLKDKDKNRGIGPEQRRIKNLLDIKLKELYPYAPKPADPALIKQWKTDYRRVTEQRRTNRERHLQEILAQEENGNYAQGLPIHREVRSSPFQSIDSAVGTSCRPTNITPQRPVGTLVGGTLPPVSVLQPPGIAGTPRRNGMPPHAAAVAAQYSCESPSQGRHGGASPASSQTSYMSSVEGTPLPTRYLGFAFDSEMPQRQQSHAVLQQLFHGLHQSAMENRKDLFRQAKEAKESMCLKTQANNQDVARQAQEQNNRAAKEYYDSIDEVASSFGEEQMKDTEALLEKAAAVLLAGDQADAVAVAAATPDNQQKISSVIDEKHENRMSEEIGVKDMDLEVSGTSAAACQGQVVDASAGKSPEEFDATSTRENNVASKKQNSGIEKYAGTKPSVGGATRTSTCGIKDAKSSADAAPTASIDAAILAGVTLFDSGSKKKHTDAKPSTEGGETPTAHTYTKPSAGATDSDASSSVPPPSTGYRFKTPAPYDPNKKRTLASYSAASSNKRSRTTGGRATGLPPLHPKVGPASELSKPSPVNRLDYKDAPEDNTKTCFLLVPPNGRPYVLDSVPVYRVMRWTMSNFRVSFLLQNGTMAIFPFQKRSQSHTTLIHSREGERYVSAVAHGSCTYTLENSRRGIQCHGSGDRDGKTETLCISGMKETLIADIYPGDNFLVVVYQDFSIDLGRNDEVVAHLDDKLGDCKGKPIRNVHVGGLFLIVELHNFEFPIEEGVPYAGDLHCIPLHEGCQVPPGPVKLPRGWQAAGIAVGYNHCLVKTLPIEDEKAGTGQPVSEPKHRVYSAGSNSFGQLGRGGISSAFKLIPALKDDNVEAVFSDKNQSCTIDAEGRLKLFGTRVSSRKPKAVATGVDIQDIAFTESLLVGVAARGDRLALVNLDMGEKACNIDGDHHIVNVHKVLAGGDYACFKVDIKYGPK